MGWSVSTRTRSPWRRPERLSVLLRHPACPGHVTGHDDLSLVRPRRMDDSVPAERMRDPDAILERAAA